MQFAPRGAASAGGEHLDDSLGAMDEIAPGLLDWAAFHDGIGQEVHSHYVAEPGVLIDPMPAGRELPSQPRLAVLTNRHHLRHATEYGCPIPSWKAPQSISPGAISFMAPRLSGAFSAAVSGAARRQRPRRLTPDRSTPAAAGRVTSCRP